LAQEAGVAPLSFYEEPKSDYRGRKGKKFMLTGGWFRLRNRDSLELFGKGPERRKIKKGHEGGGGDYHGGGEEGISRDVRGKKRMEEGDMGAYGKASYSKNHR